MSSSPVKNLAVYVTLIDPPVVSRRRDDTIEETFKILISVGTVFVTEERIVATVSSNTPKAFCPENPDSVTLSRTWYTVKYASMNGEGVGCDVKGGKMAEGRGVGLGLGREGCADGLDDGRLDG